MKRLTAKPRVKKAAGPKESAFLSWQVLGTNEERLYAAVNKLPMILFAFDQDGIITLSEGRGLKALHIKPRELVGRSVIELYRSQPHILGNIKRALAGESFTSTVNVGGVLLETQFSALHDTSGKFIGTIGVSLDVTERHRVEEALKQQKVDQQIILDSVAAMIWYKDTENRVLRCNRAAAESSGLTADKIEGHSAYDLYPEHAAKYHKDDLEVINSGKAKIGIIEEFVNASGETRWVRTDKIPYRDERGNIIGVIVFALDITDRKRVEEELRRTTSELQGIFQALPDLYFRLDSEGKILDYKTEDVSDLYVPPEEFLGKRMQDVLPHDVGLQFKKGIEKVLKTHSIISFEYGLDTKGIRQNFEARLSPTPDKHLVLIIRNITKRRQAEDALVESEERYRALFQYNPLMIFTVDENGISKTVNEEGYRQLGYRLDELVGRPVIDVFHVDDRETVKQSFTKCLQNPDHVSTWEFRKVRKSGQVVWVRETVRPFRSSDGGLLVLIVCEDITERKRAEEALRESEERYRLMFENNPMPMYVYDLETLKCLSVNDAAIKCYGYTRSEFLAMTIKDIRPAEDIPLLMRIISENPEQSRKSGPLRHKKKNGTIIEVEATSHRIKFAGHAARVVMINDVTERKQAEQALLHSQKLESLGILAGGIAHDFNNLLMGVLGNSDLALQKLEPGSRLEIHLTQIKKASMRAAELCRQLLAYSGKGRFDVSFLDLNPMIRELTTLLELSIHKCVTLNLCLEPGLPHLLGDKVQIQQVIMNLVINSSEAIGDREGQITVTTKKIHADRSYLSFARFTPEPTEGDYIMFEVKDNGCGMDSETLPRIFDPFFTTKFTGRGLGLAAVLGIVKGHGGALKVDSAAGEGTTFKLLFPSHESEKAAVAQVSDPPKLVAEEWVGSGTILVVDDEEAVRAVSELILPTLGFKALIAEDGFQACELLHQNRDDVVAVMLDLTMPKMDGVKAVQELRKIKAGLKVLLMSGFDEDEAVNRFTNEGFDCFLQKPFMSGQLLNKLKLMLEKN